MCVYLCADESLFVCTVWSFRQFSSHCYCIAGDDSRLHEPARLVIVRCIHTHVRFHMCLCVGMNLHDRSFANWWIYGTN